MTDNVKHMPWCIGFLSGKSLPCDCRIPANQPGPVVPGLCFEPSPRISGGRLYLCELQFGHAGAHQASGTHWIIKSETDNSYRQAYTHLTVQLAMPPEPWFVFGAHAGEEWGDGAKLEFWGDDGTGLPLWEKLK